MVLKLALRWPVESDLTPCAPPIPFGTTGSRKRAYFLASEVVELVFYEMANGEDCVPGPFEWLDCHGFAVRLGDVLGETISPLEAYAAFGAGAHYIERKLAGCQPLCRHLQGELEQRGRLTAEDVAVIAAAEASGVERARQEFHDRWIDGFIEAMANGVKKYRVRMHGR